MTSSNSVNYIAMTALETYLELQQEGGERGEKRRFDIESEKQYRVEGKCIEIGRGGCWSSPSLADGQNEVEKGTDRVAWERRKVYR